MKTVTTILLVFCLISCGSEDDSNGLPAENIIVYISEGSTQCNDDGINSSDSAQTLINTGIDVLATLCGFTTGLDRLTVCGAQTNSIIAHEIRKVNLIDANNLGYEDIESLVDEDNMLGYETRACSES